jgi:hypothetical protein
MHMTTTAHKTFIRSKSGEVIAFEWEDRLTYVTMTLLKGATEIIIGSPALPPAMRGEEFVLLLNKPRPFDRAYSRHIWNELTMHSGWTPSNTFTP